ncbi:hypothetical protein [Rhizobium sp.]
MPASENGLKSRRGSVVIDTTKRGKARSDMPNKVTFGSVTVLADPVADEELARNIEIGRARISAGMTRLSKPGFVLRKSKNVPYYRADPNDPNVIIRELNGDTSRGRLVDGEFVTL